MSTHLAARLALVCWLAGAAIVGATWWDAGEQASSATQLPAVLVALGAGLGLLVLGSSLWALDSARGRARRRAQWCALAVAAAEGCR
jgi:hypothetical protein